MKVLILTALSGDVIMINPNNIQYFIRKGDDSSSHIRLLTTSITVKEDLWEIEELMSSDDELGRSANV